MCSFVLREDWRIKMAVWNDWPPEVPATSGTKRQDEKEEIYIYTHTQYSLDKSRAFSATTKRRGFVSGFFPRLILATTEINKPRWRGQMATRRGFFPNGMWLDQLFPRIRPNFSSRSFSLDFPRVYCTNNRCCKIRASVFNRYNKLFIDRY